MLPKILQGSTQKVSRSFFKDDKSIKTGLSSIIQPGTLSAINVHDTSSFTDAGVVMVGMDMFTYTSKTEALLIGCGTFIKSHAINESVILLQPKPISDFSDLKMSVITTKGVVVQEFTLENGINAIENTAIVIVDSSHTSNADSIGECFIEYQTTESNSDYPSGKDVKGWSSVNLFEIVKRYGSV